MLGGRACTLLLIVATLATPSAAMAQKTPPGVHVDPGSPAGKEYAVPLERARTEAASGKDSSDLAQEGGNAAGSSGAASQGSSQSSSGSAESSEPSGSSGENAPLFGEGVTPVSDTQRGSQAAAALALKAARDSAADESSPLSSPWVLGLVVILLGLAAGLLFRRLRASGRP